MRTWCGCRRPIRRTLGPMTGSRSCGRGLDRFENLFLVGRNGMHKYNNQDHSMLTAMAVVDGIAAGYVDKDAVWGINRSRSITRRRRYS